MGLSLSFYLTALLPVTAYTSVLGFKRRCLIDHYVRVPVSKIQALMGHI